MYYLAMICPACKNTMIILEHDKIEIDHCLNCGGVWLDSGELELILDDAQKAEQLPAAIAAHSHRASPRKCPICRKRMQEAKVDGAGAQIVLDQCPKGHGWWFDKGELQATIKAAGLGIDEKIQKLLADIFGKK